MKKSRFSRNKGSLPNFHIEVLNMKNNILNELGDSSFDKDKWQWNDTKRINEQEKRITQCEMSLAILKKEVDNLIQSISPPDPSLSLDLPAKHWIKEEFHDD
jgi:hypothetical protein